MMRFQNILYIQDEVSLQQQGFDMVPKNETDQK